MCAFVLLLLRWCVWCGAQRVSVAVLARVCVCVLLLGSSSAWWWRDISVRGCVGATDGWSLCVCAFMVMLRWCVWCGAQVAVSLAVPARVCVCVLLLGSSSAWWWRDISVRGCVAATDGWSLCVCVLSCCCCCGGVCGAVLSG
eukprot:COSAG06_NODE_6850_length_2746_cov_75.454099_1_plen_143_part_00